MNSFSDSTWVPRWMMALGAVYIPWLVGVARHFNHTDASGALGRLLPGTLVTLPFQSMLGQSATLAIGAVSTVALLWLARKLLDGKGYGLLAFVALLTAINLWVGRLMAM